MLIVFIACPFLIWATWDDLSTMGRLGFIFVWAASVAGFFGAAAYGGYFIAAQAVLDIILVYIAYGDPRMRL